MIGDDAMELLKPAAIAAIGPVTERAITKAGMTVSIVPKEATIKAMVEAIIEWATRRSS
jgi:uroporphyrinogen III methyltransferase/synthase